MERDDLREPDRLSVDGASHRACQDRLSGYLDDELDAAGREAVAAHLESCPACAAVASELEEIRRQARALPPVEPARDLWPGIRQRLGEAEVVPLPVGRSAPGAWGRVVRLTVPQLAAAGLALMLATGAGVWALRPLAPGSGPAAALEGPEAGARLVSGEAGARDVSGEVAALDALLREARDRLDPNTVRILEKNLGVIERAIDEARAALEMDPGNAFLEGYLRTTLERRQQYLQETRALLEWSS